MNIVYAAGKRSATKYALAGLIENIDLTKHKLLVAAYQQHSQNIKFIDLTLDAIKEILWKESNLKILKQTIKDFKPDLIIHDFNPIIAKIAVELKIELWSLSTLHLLDGISWPYYQMTRYWSQFSLMKKHLKLFPFASRRLVYSPFGNLANPPKFYSEDFEWISPYSKKSDFSILFDNPLRKEIFVKEFEKASLRGDSYATLCDGSMRPEIVEGIYNNQWMLFAPELSSQEEVLHSVLFEYYGLGLDLGQLEYAKFLDIHLHKASQKQKEVTTKFNKKTPLLHERINL
jgi:hypothetical protein